MNFYQISKCLTEGVISEQEAFDLQAWHHSIDMTVDNYVPDYLFGIVERMCLYLNPAVGEMQ